MSPYISLHRVEVGVVGVELDDDAVEHAQRQAVHVLEGGVPVEHVAEEAEHVAVPRLVGPGSG